MKPKSTKPTLLTRRELAATFHVHMSAVTKWERDGCPTAIRGARGRPSQYDLGAVEAWRAAKAAAARTPGAVSLEQERARKERAQAALAEQMFTARAKELLPADEVRVMMVRRAAAIRTKLLSWATTLGDALHRAATLDGMAGIERVLDAAVKDVLLELASGQAGAGPPIGTPTIQARRPSTRRRVTTRRRTARPSARRDRDGASRDIAGSGSAKGKPRNEIVDLGGAGAP